MHILSVIYDFQILHLFKLVS